MGWMLSATSVASPSPLAATVDSFRASCWHEAQKPASLSFSGGGLPPTARKLALCPPGNPKGPRQAMPRRSSLQWEMGFRKKKNLGFLVPWCITSEAHCLVTFQRVPMRLSCHSSNPLMNTCLIGFSSLPLFLSPLPAIATPRNSLF